MKYFSGFTCRDEQYLFEEFIDKSEFSICGFSYGAQKALNKALNSTSRVDKLQLFSPAIFQNRSEKFKKLQLKLYNANSALYVQNFRINSYSPQPYDEDILLSAHNEDELRELLYYEYSKNDLQELERRGVDIEVYYSCSDKITTCKDVKDIFLDYATLYEIKSANHFLML
ncbi:MAG: pimelyl-ACP methyl ester esterase BioV [Campylobacterota bacterium]|nr:pimelyl-ACP methyl ester esterase BioV [Campylobacterota bacterium]